MQSTKSANINKSMNQQVSAGLSLSFFAAEPDSWREAWCAYGLAKFSAVLDRAGPYLSSEERKDAADAGYLFLQHYAGLAQRDLKTARCCYKFRPKLHHFHHMLWELDNGSTLNPRLFDCSNDENVNGKSVRCIKALHPATLGRRFLERWLAFAFCVAQ